MFILGRHSEINNYDMIKISLVIPAYNEEKYIGQCLDSVIANADKRIFEIIVVDNVSTDKTAEVARQRPGVKVVREEGKGTNKARQRGLLEATGDFVAYIDADTRMPKEWPETADKFFEKNPKAVCLSGPYKYYDGSKFQNLILALLWNIFAPLMYFIVGYMVLGGNFVAKRSALLAMGGFDTSFKFYGDDTDIARRLHEQGRVVFKIGFFMYSSSRRFSNEGVFKMSFLYAINFIWGVLFHKPFNK